MAKKLNSFRVFHGTTADPQIAMVAARQNLPRATVLGVWLALQEFASTGTPRGSLKACSPEYLAITLGLPTECIQALIADMKQQKILDPSHGFSGWLKKQHHSTERVRHFRAQRTQVHHDDPREVLQRRARLSSRERSALTKE